VEATVKLIEPDEWILRALCAGATQPGPVMNRHDRRAMAKHMRKHKVVAAPLAATLRLGATPRDPATRKASTASTGAREAAGLLGAAAAPTFNPISSNLAFGPPADIAMGWDGTLWAIDASGAPHSYDPVGDRWQPQGEGVDAAALVGDLVYHFRGSQYVTVRYGTNQAQGAPQEIGARWPDLPHSFTLGVDGAACVNGGLYLFRGGWYAKVDTPTSTFKLTDLQNWPAAPDWTDGVIDAVASNGSNLIRLFRGAEYIEVDLPGRQVLSKSPTPIASFGPWQRHVPPEWVAGGFDAAFAYGGGDSNYTIYRGTALVSFSVTDQDVAPARYIAAVYGDWPATWNPVLQHAPDGRVGGLYAATASGGVLCHDSDGWNALAPLPNSGQAQSVSVGRDGTVYAATATTLHQLGGPSWSPGASPGFTLAQVAVGDSSRVWVRDAANNVHDFVAAGGSFALNTLAGQPVDLAANADGTLWHCTAADANAYRFISEGTQPPEAIALPAQAAAAQASVAKVASTGFGNAYCLVRQPAAAAAQPGEAVPVQLYTYTSNYLFKTSASYNTPTWATTGMGWGTIAQGLGLLFVADVEVGAEKVSSAIAALDLHTGQERWRAELPADVRCTNPVFDPINQLVYYGTSGGWLVAVDARIGGNVWAYGTPGGAAIDAEPALSGSTLCFGDRSGAVYAFDTVAAARRAPGTTQTPLWRGAGPTGTAATRVGTPLIFNAAVFAVSSLNNNPSAPDQPTEFAVTRWDVVSGEQDPGFNVSFTLPTGITAEGWMPRQPVAGTTTGLDGCDTPAIFVNAADRIVALYWTPFARVGWKEYQLEAIPSQNYTWATTDLTYDGGRLWFGSQGRLYALDGRTLRPTANAPAQMPFTWAVGTAPVVYADSAGNSYVLFAAAISAGEHRLWIFDPSQPAGQANPASVDTGQTTVTQLSATVANGVVYAAGSADWSPSQPAINPATGQVFAINVNRATQALRDFIIESQLMQDFDDPPQPQANADPPTFARYQTHLTVVDEHKAPRPFEAVKVWADQPAVISISGGAPVTVGPGDDDFAVTQTGADGSLTITTGHVNNDGRDDTDMFATPLRVWAGFMDQYERVIIYPDREFHNRVAAAQAVTDPAKPGYDNPDVVNLQTAQNYSGTALFTAGEQKQQQPRNIANAVQAMTKAVGVGGGSSGGLAAWTGRLADTPGKYIAYDELPGGGYFATNVPAARPATAVQPIGLSYVSNDDNSVPSSFTTLAHADATAAIDALDGRDWTQSQLAAEPLLGGVWSSFWHWLKGAAATITHIIVSVGKEIYAGIRFIYNNVVYFFKHPLQTLEDIVSAIGAFFQKLAKLIKNVVEALSILFHLDEIVKTHTILRDELLKRINGDPANPAGYPGYVSLIKGTVIPHVDAFFEQGEDAIKTVLESFRKQLDPDQKISNLHGADSTPATVFAVGPRDNSAPASSHSVQCTWAMHKMTNGQQQASVGTRAAAAGGPAVPQALLDFLNAFAGRISGDGDLHATLQDAKTDMAGLISAKSVGEFVDRGLSVLLDAVELLLEGVLAVANAFIDGLLAVFADLLTFLFDPSSGLLTRTINIPVLSWLYKKLFGEDLTILNLIMLVAAIPVTIVYRVLTGHYPSKDLQQSPGLVGEAINRPALRNTFGILGAVCTIVVGHVNAVADLLGQDEGSDFSDDLEDITGAIAICAALIGQGTTEPQVSALDPGATDWAIWGLAFAPIGLATMSYELRAHSNYETPANELLDKAQSVVLALCSIAIWAVATIAIAKKKNPDTVDLLAYAAALLVNAPGIVNPLKYFEIIGLIVPILDIFGGWGSAACGLIATGLSWDHPVGVALP
jgi:hypothetical protein